VWRSGRVVKCNPEGCGIESRWCYFWWFIRWKVDGKLSENSFAGKQKTVGKFRWFRNIPSSSSDLVGLTRSSCRKKFSVPLTSESVTSGQAGGVFRQLFLQCTLTRCHLCSRAHGSRSTQFKNAIACGLKLTKRRVDPTLLHKWVYRISRKWIQKESIRKKSVYCTVYLPPILQICVDSLSWLFPTFSVLNTGSGLRWPRPRPCTDRPIQPSVVESFYTQPHSPKRQGLAIALTCIDYVTNKWCPAAGLDSWAASAQPGLHDLCNFTAKITVALIQLSWARRQSGPDI
jgi:hypothetical protein